MPFRKKRHAAPLRMEDARDRGDGEEYHVYYNKRLNEICILNRNEGDR